MELRHLLALEAVLSTGSFTAAAAARHLSQPALWAQIKDLERDLGLPLFARAGRGVVPTAACEALRPALRIALEDVSELRRAASEIRQGREAPARIGCAPSHVSSFLAGCIRELVDRDPNAPFPVIVPVTTGTAIETLTSGRIDLLVEPRDEPSLPDAVRLYDVEVVAVGPRARGARNGRIELASLDRVPLATLPPDSILRKQLDEEASASSVVLRVVHESRDAGALLALARLGLVTTILHDEMLEERAARRCVRVLGRGAVLASKLWLVTRPDETLTPAARMLRDVMRRRARARARTR